MTYRKHVHDALKSWMQHLAKVDRMVVLLYFADGLTKSEISAVLDVAPTKVDQILAHARHKTSQLIGSVADTAQQGCAQSPSAISA